MISFFVAMHYLADDRDREIPQTASPPIASPQPTKPVEARPKPAAIAMPPSQGPSAFATLKAE
jgi:hypothetical protein